MIDLFSNLAQDLFIPEERNILNLSQTVTNKFAFVGTLDEYITQIQNMVYGVMVLPTLEVEVNSTRYTNSGTLKIVDLSWYLPYKPYGDLILTAFIYGAFIWRMFIKLPNMINGLGGTIDIINKGGKFQ